MHQVTPATSFSLPSLLVLPTRDGSNTVFSHPFGASYHSLHGAVAESRHVFILNGLAACRVHDPFRILEFGFGTGLNALLARAFTSSSGLSLSYTGLETIRLPRSLVRKLEYPGYIVRPDLEPLFFRMHEEDNFEAGGFSFQLTGSLDDLEPGTGFHCVFFDAFAPGHQPEAWSQSVFDRIFDDMAPGGILVTYCAQGEVRRRLQAAGFAVERLPGPLGKREMLRARKGHPDASGQ